MRLTTTELGIRLYLSRRNLVALLAKLDGHPKDSQCSIFKDGITVIAEEDDVHYQERSPGRMHPETEKQMKVIRDADEESL